MAVFSATVCLHKLVINKVGVVSSRVVQDPRLFLVSLADHWDLHYPERGERREGRERGEGERGGREGREEERGERGGRKREERGEGERGRSERGGRKREEREEGERGRSKRGGRKREERGEGGRRKERGKGGRMVLNRWKICP